MTVIFEERASDSRFVERVWNSYSETSGPLTSIAAHHSMLVVEKIQGRVKLYLRGPETKATAVLYPEGEWVGIIFKFGTFMPHLPNLQLVDSEVNLPEASNLTFWLNGSVWQYPTYDNADTFIDRLVRENLLTRDSVVNNVIEQHPLHFSSRSVQRRFLRATGLNYTDARLIERARYAMTLLRQGTSILDTVHQAGYFDQAHLTRSLKRFIGHTPAQLMDKEQTGELSFAYNTELFRRATIDMFV